MHPSHKLFCVLAFSLLLAVSCSDDPAPSTGNGAANNVANNVENNANNSDACSRACVAFSQFEISKLVATFDS